MTHFMQWDREVISVSELPLPPMGGGERYGHTPDAWPKGHDGPEQTKTHPQSERVRVRGRDTDCMEKRRE